MKRLLIVLALSLCSSSAWADTLSFPIATGTDIVNCESVRVFGGGWPPPFQDCYDSSPLYIAKYFGGTVYYVEVGLLRWDTSVLADATVSSASLDVCVYQNSSSDADARSLNCEWYNAAWGPGIADYTTGSTSTALSVALSSLNQATPPCTVNTLALTAPAANIQTSGTTALRCTISGGQPTGFNDLPLVGAEDLSHAPHLNVTFDSFTPTAGGGPTLTRTSTPTFTPTPTNTGTPTPCIPTVHAASVETTVTLPNGIITVPSPGIPPEQLAILSIAYSMPSAGLNNLWGQVTDSAGNRWACDGGTAASFTIQDSVGCPPDQVGLQMDQRIAGAMCTLSACHVNLPAGSTISIPGQQVGTTTAAVSLTTLDNVNTGSAAFKGSAGSIPYPCQCYPPNGQGPTIGGLWSTIDFGAINCNLPIIPPQTHSGIGSYYGEIGGSLNGQSGTSIPAGYLLWSSIGSETSFAPTAGSIVSTVAAPGAVLTTLYQMQTATGTWSLGGTSGPQKWAAGSGGFPPLCVSLLCPATPTATPTGPTPTPSETRTITETPTGTPPTATPTNTPLPPTATFTVTHTATVTPTPALLTGCCQCPQPICMNAVTYQACVLEGCTFGGVGTICVEVNG